MAKKSGIMPYIIFGVPALIAIYLIYKSIRGSKGQDAPDKLSPQEDIQTEPSTSGNGVKPTVSKYFPLRKGSKGAKVTELQEALKSLGKDLGSRGVDGDFGSKTEAALKSTTNKITVDNQQELDDIKAIKATQEANAAANSNRLALANKLVSFYNQSPSFRNFYALNKVAVGKYKVTSDGREIKESSPVFVSGQKLTLSRNANFKITSTGFINAYDGSMMYYFSPYAFEVK